MEFNPTALASTIVGGLIVAALAGWIRKPRLIVLVPRSFSYSQITDRGQLVEVSVFNRGFKTEETIDITLNHAMRYELVGSNSQEVLVSGNKITIPRVGPSDDVTVLLLVEPGTFKSNDIIQCLSKETMGRTVEKVENIPPNGPQRIAIVGGFVVIPFFLYGMTFAMDYVVKVLKPLPSAVTDLIKQAPIDVGNWKIPFFLQRELIAFRAIRGRENQRECRRDHTQGRRCNHPRDSHESDGRSTYGGVFHKHCWLSETVQILRATHGRLRSCAWQVGNAQYSRRCSRNLGLHGRKNRLYRRTLEKHDRPNAIVPGGCRGQVIPNCSHRAHSSQQAVGGGLF